MCTMLVKMFLLVFTNFLCLSLQAKLLNYVKDKSLERFALYTLL